MNERIKELAEQASKQSPDGYPVTIPYNDDFVKKFAERIVKECSSIVGVAESDQQLFTNEAYDRGYFDGRNDAASMIIDTFGVENDGN